MKVETKKPRPRGFVEDYNPGPGRLIDAALAVISDYKDQLPLTLRQLFYLLVTRGVVDKNEKAYRNILKEAIGMARRAQLIPMDVLRNDEFRFDSAPGWESEQAFINTVRNSIDNFTLDRQQGQPRRLLVWCEDQGMVPQLERVAHKYGVRVASSGGFDSITAKHDMARWLAKRPTTVLHIGDYDPSGVHVYGSLDEDVHAFVGHYGGDVRFCRIAVTPEQIDRHDLPTAPVKGRSDGRNLTFDGDFTVQAEALPPDTLAAILKQEIEDRIDALAEVLRQEKAVRAALADKFKTPIRG